MEAPEVFAESHRLVFELLVRGDVDGLRIDHIDGLYDPMEYLRRLQKEYLVALGRALSRAHDGGRPAAVGRARTVRLRRGATSNRCLSPPRPV